MGLRPLFGDEMKKIVLRQGIIAAVVITALACCSDEPVDVSSVNSVSDCLVQGLGNEQQCRAAWDQASSEHLKEGPRFEAKEDCSEEFGQCNRYQVQNDDGSFSDVFIPMMAGMMIGNMMSSSNTHHVYHQPLYKRKDQQAYGGGFVTAGGYTVQKGTSIIPSSYASKPSGVGTISKGGLGGGGFSTSSGKGGGFSAAS